MIVSDMSVIRKVLQENGESIWQFVDSNFSEGSRTGDSTNIKSSASKPEAALDIAINNTEVSIGKKKKKKKSRSKKLRSGSTCSEKSNCIQWGTVEEILFTRDLSYDSIPRQGFFPLGLGTEVDRQILSIDDYISSRKSELQTRAATLGIAFDLNGSNNFRCSPSDSSDIYATYAPMETRQYDYRAHGSFNQLFHHLSENERQSLLTAARASHPKEVLQDMTRIHNELKLVQSSRDKAHLGCTCKQIKVDKLSVGKIKLELQSQGHLIGLDPGAVACMTKSDLTLRMKELAKACTLCLENKCECVQLGLPCSSEICGCLKHGYRPGQQQVCGNALGRTVFDPEAVHSYRVSVIASANQEFLTESSSFPNNATSCQLTAMFKSEDNGGDSKVKSGPSKSAK